MTKENKNILIAVVLMCSVLPVMSAISVVPAIPKILEDFIDIKNAELLCKLIVTLPAFVIAVFSMGIGHLADKFGRKKILIISMVLYGLVGTSGFYLNNLYLILAGRFVFGFAVAGTITTLITIGGDSFTGEARNKFVGTQGAVMAFGGVFLLILGGALADIHWKYNFLIYSYSLLVLGLAIKFIPETGVKKELAQSDTEVNLKTFSPLILFIYSISFFSMLMFYIIPIQIPFYMKSVGDFSQLEVSVILAITTFVAATMSFLYKRLKRKLSYFGIYSVMYFFIGLSYVLVSNSTSFTSILISLSIAGLGTGLIMPASNLWIMEVSPASRRGFMVGILTSVTFLGQFSSPLVFQPFIEIYSIKSLLLYAGILMLVLFLCFLVYDRKNV